jgi:hypothetical protein
MWDPYTTTVNWRLLNMDEPERQRVDARVARGAPVVASALRAAARMLQLNERRPARQSLRPVPDECHGQVV